LKEISPSRVGLACRAAKEREEKSSLYLSDRGRKTSRHGRGREIESVRGVRFIPRIWQFSADKGRKKRRKKVF
jgi:hypothetical protein